MTDDQPATSIGTGAADYGRNYYTHAHFGSGDDYGWDFPHWRTFFTMVAERIVGLTEPQTALDVGCATGMLVQALRYRGVDAKGFDFSEFAVNSAHQDVRDHLWVGSATDPIEGRYDLISCIEVLEHMAPTDAQKALDSICAATDKVLFSSCPTEFEEPTHINSHPTSQWAAWFAERGFYRNTGADATFLAGWAVVFERAD
ncbi:MAG TPA: class I SAM-dependent methyltransferase, partial [Nocardioidaceae bacterium]|nr:class I SAM-dependent methyltransferase [Nocardioidaceae bacterium]